MEELPEGDSAGREEACVSAASVSSGKLLPEGCGPSSPHRQLDPGSAHSEHLEPSKEMFMLQAIMQSDK